MKISQSISKIKNGGIKRKRERKQVHSVRIEPWLEHFGIWVTSMSQGENPAFTFENHYLVSEGRMLRPVRTFECLSILESFLAVRSPEDAFRFFNMYGPLQLAGDGSKKVRIKGQSVWFSQVQRFQGMLLSASQGKYGKPAEESDTERIRAKLEDFYISSGLSAELHIMSMKSKGQEAQIPVVTVRCMDVEEALRTAVYLDRMNGLVWALCARERCGRPFRIGGHKNKVYCSQACAEVQAQTNYAEKKKRKLAEESGAGTGSTQAKRGE